MFILLDFVDSYFCNKLCNKNEWKNNSGMLNTFLTTNHVKTMYIMIETCRKFDYLPVRGI